MQCPDCGAENPDGSKFCTSCGKKLSESSQTETTDFSTTTYDETSEQTINHVYAARYTCPNKYRHHSH